ncbi:MAG: hypothetical protein LBD80_06800 [Tannerella sp.]|jgi:tetratricopeptide (TPR) repeat protein|nr:hypothetical protein [Tannerella sp.]
MKYGFYFFALMLSITGNMTAQELKYEQTPENIAYNGEGRYAIIIIRANNSLELEFSTNLDGDRSVIKKIEKNEVGNQTEYTLTFDALQVNEAKLQIQNKKYNQLIIQFKLSPNGAVAFVVKDPDDPDNAPCHIKHKKYGDKFFLAANYEGAKDEYSSSLECWPENERGVATVKRRLADIETISYLMEEIKNTDDRKKIYELYDQAYRLNPADKDMEEKKENVFKDYTGGTVKDGNRNQPHYALTYEYGTDAPAGLSAGIYKPEKIGAYFTLRLNPHIFAMMSSNTKKSFKAEFNTSAGLSVPVLTTEHVSFWTFLGAGYTGVAQHMKKSYTSSDYKTYLHSAVSPEAGILMKIPLQGTDRIVLRYTFQYRYALDRENGDFIGNIQNVIGVGFNF